MVFLNQGLSRSEIDKKNALYVKLANDIYSYLGSSCPNDDNAGVTTEEMCSQAIEILDDLYRYDLLDDFLSVSQSPDGWINFSWYVDANHEVAIDMDDVESRKEKLAYMFDFPEWRSTHKKWLGEVTEVAEIKKVIRMFLSIMKKEEHKDESQEAN